VDLQPTRLSKDLPMAQFVEKGREIVGTDPIFDPPAD
jgi:hypothetical protein